MYDKGIPKCIEKGGEKERKKEFISLNYPLDDFVLGGDATKIAKNLHLYNGKGSQKRNRVFAYLRLPFPL
jgi:hypothetical protein